MSTTTRHLAELIRGELVGDGDLPIHGARPLGEAGPGDVTFVENQRHLPELPRTRASAAVVAEGTPANGLTLIRVKDPLTAFIEVMRHLHGRPAPEPCGVSPLAQIHPTARLGEGASLHPFVCIGEGTVIGARCHLHPGVVVGRFCRLGDDVTLYPQVVLYDEVTLGNRVVVHAHAVLGADGFGYRTHQGRHVKVPQLGTVEVGDDVEIGAGSAVDRGTFTATRIGEGTKIDNLVQVGHNVQIGRHNILVAQVGVGGSTVTGDHVVLAGQVGVADHLRVGPGALVGAKSGVTKDVPPGERWFGTPARPEREWMRSHVALDSVPELRRDVKSLREHLGLPPEGRGAPAGDQEKGVAA